MSTGRMARVDWDSTLDEFENHVRAAAKFFGETESSEWYHCEVTDDETNQFEGYAFLSP